MVQVLVDWLGKLHGAHAYQAASCVVRLARDALRDCHRFTGAAADDEARRFWTLSGAESYHQQAAADVPEEFCSCVMSPESWRVYCGRVSAPWLLAYTPCTHSGIHTVV